MIRRTKIVATAGPATDGAGVLEDVVRAGADVIRLNLSHGLLEEHLATLARVRAVAEHLGRPVGVLADLPGPKLRAGPFPDGGVVLAPGASIGLVPGDGTSDARVVTVGYPSLLDDVEVGDRVVLGDGAISMRVVEATVTGLVAAVETGGHVVGRPGVNLSSQRLRTFAPTAQDLELADAAAAAGVDYIALSFVRRAADVAELRAVVGDRAAVVAKIETSAALADLAGITRAADALMIARGDLGIDCPLEDVPHLQKQILRHCVEVGRPVITATQMLESMVTAASPTRAEVSDVANAVYDGTDAVMLSGETAIGHDPALVVTTMARIAARAESDTSYRSWAEHLGRSGRPVDTGAADRITAAVTHAAWQAVLDTDATAILCCTRSGRTARAMARFRPPARLVGLSPDQRTVNALTLSWGVEAFRVDEYSSSDEMVWFAVEESRRHGLVGVGDIVVVLAGSSHGRRGAATDVMRIVEVT